MFNINNITKTYENGFVAIKDLSLQLQGTGMVAFIGPSGAGKTTLLNLLSMNDNITSGDIEFDGVHYSRENRSQIVSDFAYIYQDFKLIENLSVEDNLRIAMELCGEDVNINEIYAVLEQVGLKNFANEKVLRLSAGQKQRIAIARSIIRKPKVLFADEPTGNLDSENSDNILELLQRLSQDMLVLIVTHDTERIQHYADRIIKINDGKLESDAVLNNKADVKSRAVSYSKREKKKSRLSPLSTLKLSKSLNSSKKARQIVFSAIIMLLIAVLVPLSSWSFVTYEKSVISTLNSVANTKGMFVEANVNYQLQTETGQTGYNGKADLTGLQGYIEEHIGKTAQVIDISRAKRISNQYLITRKIDKDNNPISMADACAFNATQYVILSDNPADIGIEKIKGEFPKNKFEYMISSGMYDYVNAVGCVKNPDEDSDIDYIEVTGDELIGKEIYGVKIVGVFEDNFEADKKYRTHSSMETAYGDLDSFGDDWQNEQNNLMKQIFENILCNSVITATATAEYYRDTYYMTHRRSGEYVKAELGVGENKEMVTFAPLNDSTKIFAGGASLNAGEILVPDVVAERLSLNQGDAVTFNTALMVDSQHLDFGEQVIKQIASKEFSVVIDANISSVFLSESDFDLVTDNFALDNELIYMSTDNLSAAELVGIRDYINDEYDIAEYDINNGANFIFDYSRDIKNNYNFVKSLVTVVAVVLSIIAIVYLALAYNIVSINITGKANDLLVLKSLGATRVQFAKVYSISMILHIVVEFAVGCVLGWLLLLGLNGILGVVQETVTTLVPFDAVSIAIMFALIVVVNILVLAVNLLKINDNNLRKAFQKIKE